MASEDKSTVLITAYDEEVPDEIRPEKNLLLAILVSAMNDLKRNGRVSRQAQEFFMSEDERYIFSFRSICDHLEMDPNKILLVTGLREAANDTDPKPTGEIPKSLATLR